MHLTPLGALSTTFNSVPIFFGAGTKKVEHEPGSE